MGRGSGVSPKRNFKRGVRSKDSGSDESDEDYVVSDEENEVSACSDEDDFGHLANGYTSEASDLFAEEEVRRKVNKAGRSKQLRKQYDKYNEDEDEDDDEDYNDETEKVKKNGRLRGGFSSVHTNEVKSSQKRRRVVSKEEEDDDDDEEFTPSNNEEEEKVGRSKNPNKRYDKYKEDEDEDEDEDDDDDEDYSEEIEKVKTNGRLKGSFSSVHKKEVEPPSQKRRRVVSKEEEEDDDDEEFTPSNNEEDEDEEEDDDFTADDEDDSFDEEVSRVKRKKAYTKPSKRVSRKKSSKKKRKRYMASKKVKKATGSRRKVSSSDDDDDFTDNGFTFGEEKEVKRGPKKRRFVIDSDSDFAPAPSNDYDYTISEEEREQVREAKEFCRAKNELRSSSTPEKVEEDKVLAVERKGKGRKGKEKVEDEVKTEIVKGVCGICLSEEDKRRVRGTISCCEHYFCFTCISEWAKVESRCPLCKQRFKTISKRARVADSRLVTVNVPERDQVYLPTEEELRSYLYPYEDVICSECHQGGHDDLMLLCDECDSSAHTFCVGLGHEVPEGSWYCRCCKPFDPEFPQSDHRLAPITARVSLSAGISNSGEVLDLNSVSSQGLAGLSSPRQQFGAAMPPAGASTVSGRIRLRHQIHHCLSERPDRPDQLDQARETTMQQERICENQGSMRPTWQKTDPATSDPPTSSCDVDFHTAKEQFQVAVKSHLQNLSRGSDLGQSKLEEIAKCSTQAILRACGLEHNEVPVSPPPACHHIELTVPSVVRGCCSSCFDSFVGDIVKKLLDAKLSEVQQWLCLAL